MTNFKFLLSKVVNGCLGYTTPTCFMLLLTLHWLAFPPELVREGRPILHADLSLAGGYPLTPLEPSQYIWQETWQPSHWLFPMTNSMQKSSTVMT